MATLTNHVLICGMPVPLICKVMGFLMMNFLFPLFHFQAYTHVSPIVYGAWNGVSYHVLLAGLYPISTRCIHKDNIHCCPCVNKNIVKRIEQASGRCLLLTASVSTVGGWPTTAPTMHCSLLMLCSRWVSGDPRHTGTRQTTGYLS